MPDLMELLDIPSARGRRSKLVASKRRDVVASDIDALHDARPLEQVTPVQQLRHQHHLLARLLAEGKKPQEASLITGYSVTYISRLQTQDRAFRELITYYKEQVTEVFVSVHERLAGLGLNTVEELQERLAEKPESFTNRELMELGELCFDRSGNGPTSTQKSVVQVLTTDDILRLKAEVGRRSNGQVREITQGRQSTPLGGLVIEGSFSESKVARTQSEGPELPAESGQASTAGNEK